MDINKLTAITDDAAKLLKQKALGGVTAESAMNAINKTKDDLARLADDAVSAVKTELTQFRGKSASEMAELTSQKDKVILQTKEEAKKALEAANAKTAQVVKQLKTPKTAGKVLQNGNTEIRKVNKNGAVMVKEVLPNGKTIRAEVTNLAGDHRKTTYNPASGKPVKTFTNTNGDKLIEYTPEGNAIKTNMVNNKKLKPMKPTALKPEILKEDYNVANIKQAYSDGSYELVEYSKHYKAPLKKELFNANGQQVSQAKYLHQDGQVTIEKTVFDPKTKATLETHQESRGLKTIDKYNDKKDVIERVELYSDGSKKIVKPTIDEYGFVDNKNCKVKLIYPKNSKIKNAEISFIKNQEYYPDKEILKMKDGSTAVVSKIDGNYNIRKIETTPKTGGPATVITEAKDIENWTKENGLITYHSENPASKNIYYGSI